MLLRCATMATGVMMTGVAFAAGLGLGAAAVGGACLARRAMKQRSQWRDEDRAMAPEQSPRTVIAWDERCLAYHRQERPVFTASALQVRERPHERAVARWKPYAAFLGPLHAIAEERARVRAAS